MGMEIVIVGMAEAGVLSRVVVPRERRVHVTHEVHHVVHNERRRVRPAVVDHENVDEVYNIIERPGFRGSVHIVEDNQPDVVVVEYGGQAYLQPTQVVINHPPVTCHPVKVHDNPIQYVPVYVQGNPQVAKNPYRTGAIDPTQ
jgi:hypothetical protein